MTTTLGARRLMHGNSCGTYVYAMGTLSIAVDPDDQSLPIHVRDAGDSLLQVILRVHNHGGC